MISFKVNPQQQLQIAGIARRAAAKGVIEPDAVHVQSTRMDLSALIAQGTKLDLKELLEFGDDDFEHDIRGIAENIDRDDDSPTGGKLLNLFSPRCEMAE